MGNLPKWREMDRKRPHQPERFASYTEMIDDDGHVYGFRLPDGQVFKTDEEGGWYDEYRNYYDANGNPANPPAFGDDDDFEDGDHDSLLDDYDFQEDDLNSVDYSDVQNLVDIETKVDQLRKQVGQSSFRLFIASLPSWANEYKLRAFFCEGRQIKNISIVVSSHPNNDRRKEATITLTDLEDAIECVRKHRKVSVPYEELNCLFRRDWRTAGISSLRWRSLASIAMKSMRIFQEINKDQQPQTEDLLMEEITNSEETSLKW
eukprot:TRINITY_DN1377_c0_g2_i1.p1 TRINITY_DN1377_c0_g2~~TRINITY_DN1377_c0_g2_i1.p1  ORF type:complete len:262 (+),score=59.63 TRINITY_DN1377_c0_g2_i1:101-886(+)